MKTATLKQGKKVLSLLENVPEEQLQKLLASGLLTDLLKANVDRVNRDEFQKLIFLRFHFLPTFGCDHTKEGIGRYGFTLERDSEDKEGDFTPELVDIFKKDEQKISGGELLRRVEEQRVWCGQRHLEAMQHEQDKIPKEYQEKTLLFPGTLFRQKGDGSLWVPSLFWSPGWTSSPWLSSLRGLMVDADDREAIDRHEWLVRPRK